MVRGEKDPFNPFFDLPDGPHEHPREYYGFVDQIEPDPPNAEGSATVLLDCLGANWFDQQEDHAANWETLKNAPLAVIQAELPPAKLGRKSAFDLRRLGQWLQIRFEQQGELAATRFTNLVGASDRGFIDEIATLDTRRAGRLKRFFSTKNIEPLNESKAESLFAGRDSIDFVNVMDVGQGSANALVESNHGARLYFDAGGGVLQHKRTYPGNLTFCVAAEPPVVLSHWDWDHWSSAMIHGHHDLQDLSWIVPDQGSLSGVHAAFAAAIAQSGNLYLWPSSWSDRTFGRITIQRCTGNPGNRNDSGLAMLIRGPSPKDDPIILTGDADYRHIPATHALSGKYQAVVVPHHGGRARTKHPVASPNGSPTRRLVYSYGLPNYYKHPHVTTIQAHRNQGWRGQETRQTAARSGQRPQHVGIGWTGGRYQGGCPGCNPSQW